jgi:putative ABC transport system permease protein
MSWLDGIRHRLQTLLTPAAYARDLEEEMRIHAELDASHQRDPGGTARRFGNRTYYKEETRRLTWLRFADVVRQDLSYAWRTVRRSPGFTAVVVVTLALGIGANASVFSLLDRIYLRPPGGVSDPWSLRRTWVEHFRTASGIPFKSQAISYVTYEAITAATGTTGQTALYRTEFASRLGRHPSDPTVGVVYATANYFNVLGVKAAMGRFFTSDEDRIGNGAAVAVVSHAFWKARLHGDSAALGTPLPIGATVYTVIGVADPGFTGLDLRSSDVWVPLASVPASMFPRPRWWMDETATVFETVRRATSATSDAEYRRRATAVLREMNRREGVRGDTLATVWTGPILEARGPATPGQELVVSTRLAGVAVMVLLIAAANVINLLLARATSRRREIAVRIALGVSRARLVRMLTTETLLLALMAGAAGLLASWWGASVLRALIMPEIPWSVPAVDARVAAFAVVVTLAAGIVAGIVPAMQTSNPRLTSALKAGAREGVRHRSRLRSMLVVTQTALSVTLLVGSVLFVRSLHNVQSLDIGFDADRLVFGRVQFADGESPPGAVLSASMRDVAAGLRGRPGVEAIARADMEPMRGIGFLSFYRGADSSASFGRRAPTVSAVSPSFFRTVGLRMLHGRTFDGDDATPGPTEVVVNEAMAKLVWPGRDPIGDCLRFESRETPCFTVVGVVETARLTGVIEPEQAAQFYVPLGSSARRSSGATIVVRASQTGAGAAAAELAGALRRAFPGAVPTVTPMMANLEPEYRPWRLGASLFTALGLLAVAVAVVGIYGTVSYGVTQRTHEFGVRAALGASAGDVVGQVVGEGVRTVAVGVALGIALSLAAGRVVGAMLYGIAPRDPGVLGSVAVGLLAVAALAALVPAWRAARADPLTALRAD